MISLSNNPSWCFVDLIEFSNSGIIHPFRSYHSGNYFAFYLCGIKISGEGIQQPFRIDGLWLFCTVISSVWSWCVTEGCVIFPAMRHSPCAGWNKLCTLVNSLVFHDCKPMFFCMETPISLHCESKFTVVVIASEIECWFLESSNIGTYWEPVFCGCPCLGSGSYFHPQKKC